MVILRFRVVQLLFARRKSIRTFCRDRSADFLPAISYCDALLCVFELILRYAGRFGVVCLSHPFQKYLQCSAMCRIIQERL